jgi:hypothetical protein
LRLAREAAEDLAQLYPAAAEKGKYGAPGKPDAGITATNAVILIRSVVARVRKGAAGWLGRCWPGRHGHPDGWPGVS